MRNSETVETMLHLTRLNGPNQRSWELPNIHFGSLPAPLWSEGDIVSAVAMPKVSAAHRVAATADEQLCLDAIAARDKRHSELEMRRLLHNCRAQHDVKLHKVQPADYSNPKGRISCTRCTHSGDLSYAKHFFVEKCYGWMSGTASCVEYRNVIIRNASITRHSTSRMGTKSGTPSSMTSGFRALFVARRSRILYRTTTASAGTYASPLTCPRKINFRSYVPCDMRPWLSVASAPWSSSKAGAPLCL